MQPQVYPVLVDESVADLRAERKKVREYKMTLVRLLKWPERRAAEAKYYDELTPEDHADMREERNRETCLGWMTVRVAIIMACGFAAAILYFNNVVPADKLAARLLPANCTLNGALMPYVGRCHNANDGFDCVVVPLNFTVNQGEKERLVIFLMDGFKIEEAYYLEHNRDTIWSPGSKSICYTDGVDLALYLVGVESKRYSAKACFWVACVTAATFVFDGISMITTMQSRSKWQPVAT